MGDARHMKPPDLFELLLMQHEKAELTLKSSLLHPSSNRHLTHYAATVGLINMAYL